MGRGGGTLCVVVAAFGLATDSVVAQRADADTSLTAAAQHQDFAFYRGRPYGTDAYMGPLDVLLNKGFAVAQFNNRNRFIFDYEYAAGHVWRSLTELPSNVEDFGGWGKLIREEVLPLSLDWREWKWAPNYVGHVLEGGITNRKLREWYSAHRVPLPGVAAFVTSMGAAVINEMYAHPTFTHGTAATATDLLLFDPLGILLFSNDGVARFFSERLGGTVWPSQAALTLEGELVNNGNNVILKLPVSPIPRTSIFFRGGLSVTPGLTFHTASGLDVSLAFGAEGRVQQLDPVTGEETPELALGGGVFVDRHGSLLASVLASQVEHRRLVLNVYPGVIPLVGGRFGAWLLIRDGGAVRFGLSARGAFGLGLAGGFR